MLVLTRKTGQVIVIGESILVTILSVRGNQVRLGLSAPTGVAIRREELMSTTVSRPINEAHSEAPASGS
jgi:carbon storage regulator